MATTFCKLSLPFFCLYLLHSSSAEQCCRLEESPRHTGYVLKIESIPGTVNIEGRPGKRGSMGPRGPRGDRGPKGERGSPVSGSPITEYEDRLKAMEVKLEALWRASGWIVYNDLGYFFTDIGTNWHEAGAICRKKGGRLLAKGMLDSSIRGRILSEVKRKQESFWIGLNDISREGVYVWSTGDVLSSRSSLWAPKEPSDGRRGNCCTIWKDPLLVDDTDCNNKYRAICEIEL